MPAHTTWTDEEHKTLLDMWEAGHTAAEIAKALGKTRNSILGRVYRQGISRNGVPLSWWRKQDDGGDT
jgi:GcrA cell cycle regulator